MSTWALLTVAISGFVNALLILWLSVRVNRNREECLKLQMTTWRRLGDVEERLEYKAGPSKPLPNDPLLSAPKQRHSNNPVPTIRNTQPYGANVDAIAQHTSVREGSY